MSVVARQDRREARRQETKEDIVAAAWDLVRDNGLAGLAMRDLGDRVGMKAQSIYSYFGSKNEIYDAMFHEGYLAFEAATRKAIYPDGSKTTPGPADDFLHAAAHCFFDFCVSDPVRYQLLFQRTIPNFVPSSESYEVAVGVHELLTSEFEALGISDPAMVDLWTALLTGLSDQQLSNDPGGDRWGRIVDRAVDMFRREINHQTSTENTARNPS